MSALRLPPLSLYVHIPWCQRKCPYCDFNSHESKQDLPEQAYSNALKTDLQQSLHQVQGRELVSIFFGGGTPSRFSAAAIGEILSTISSLIPLKPEAEITLEANPASAEVEKFQGFAEAGVNRISLGVQSFDDTRLQALGRIHSSDDALAAIEITRGLGLQSFNIDLMHGLPGQHIEMANSDMRTGLAQRPPHLSWYQLTIEPNTVFHNTPPKLPAESVLADIQDQGEAQLERAGYQCYEVSAWSQPGYHCHHNLNYWRFGDYIGIGAGAHSKWTDLGAQQVLRSARTRQPEHYINQPTAINLRVLDQKDLVGEYMMNALRLREGFDTGEFSARTGLPYACIEQTVTHLAGRDLLSMQGTQIKPGPLGWRYLDNVIGEFFQRASA